MLDAKKSEYFVDLIILRVLNAYQGISNVDTVYYSGTVGASFEFLTKLLNKQMTITCMDIHEHTSKSI